MAMANQDLYIFIKWSDSEYGTGIETIDTQHKKLIELINEIYQSFLERRQADATAKVLDELEDYTKYHFGYEERLFKRFGYGHAEQHTASHTAFINKVKEFRKSMDAGVDVTFTVTNYLRDWLRRHIQHEDRMYAPLFKKEGII